MAVSAGTHLNNVNFNSFHFTPDAHRFDFCDGEHWKQQDNPSLDQLAEGILADEELGFRKSSELRKIEQTSKKAEIFKVLIVRWLMSKGPIAWGQDIETSISAGEIQSWMSGWSPIFGRD